MRNIAFGNAWELWSEGKGLKGKCIDFSSRVQKKDYLISVRMAYLSFPYDKPNLPNRQLYAHVAIATSGVMTYKRRTKGTVT